MTAASDVKSTLAALKGAQASLELYALRTQSEEARTIFEDAAQTTQQVVDQLTQRVRQMENEEPQYQGF